MNKSQKLDVMILKSKIKIEEEMKQHEVSWRGEKVEIVEKREE